MPLYRFFCEVRLEVLMNRPILFVHCDAMPEEAKDHVVENLVGCAAALSAFSLVTDLNRKLALLQQINKEYNALVNKLESGNITTQDLDVAVPVAKEKIPSELRRRDNFGLNPEAAEKLVKASPSRVDQVLNFLKQNRSLEISATFSFKEPPK